MTINELKELLNEIPDDRGDEKVTIYVPGRISGFLDIKRVQVDRDVDHIHIVGQLEYAEDK